MSPRVRAFVIVGIIGFGVQLAVLSGLTGAGVPLALATALAVEAAVLHNFVWHERWTWRDRADSGGRGRRLLRFHSSTALVSIGINVVLTWLFVRLLHVPPIVANALAVAAASLANFAVADRWVFKRGAIAAGMSAAALVLGIAHTPATAAAPSRETLDAWRAYVHAVEARQQTTAPDCLAGREPEGEATRVEGGTIYHWSSCTIVRNMTVPALVDALVASGTPPPQEDVLESRLLSRDGDRLRVYLRLVRRTIVTVSYDTEHEMTFERHSSAEASSRSVATRIRQIGGGDHGFLWELQSYWRYRQVGPDVRIELVSLSLSRDIPLLVRAVVAPVVNSVARESMVRTLQALQQFCEDDDRRVHLAGPARSLATR